MRTKKIGIITLYYHNPNYGGILQAYALQKTLSKLGYDAQQISYDIESGYKNYYFYIFKKKVKNALNYCIHHRMITEYNNQKEKMYSFADLIPHTEVVKSNTISKLNSEYDIFVCGSDQIWNPIGWQPSFFLAFADSNKMKIAYAASIARSHLNEDEISYIKHYIKDFNAVSLREDESANILNSSNIGREIVVMPDPTLLLTYDEWEKIVARRMITNEYIFAYFLGNDINYRNESIKFAEKLGLNIVFISYLNDSIYSWEKENNKYLMKNIGVPEFLSLIKYSRCVLTDSYHGAIFSVLFQKSFYVFNRFKDNDMQSMNSRLRTLLDTLQLQNRELTQIPNSIEEIDFDEVSNKISYLREKGVSFLRSNLG